MSAMGNYVLQMQEDFVDMDALTFVATYGQAALEQMEEQQYEQQIDVAMGESIVESTTVDFAVDTDDIPF